MIIHRLQSWMVAFLLAMNSSNRSFLKIDRTLRRLTLFVLVAYSSATCVAAQFEKESPSDLIGKEVEGAAYPNGWKQLGSTGFGRSSFTLSTLERRKSYVMLLERKLGDLRNSENPRVVVTDVIGVRNPTNYHNFSRLCYFSDAESSKATSNILAEVRFEKYCDVKTTKISRAWRINLTTGKFDQLQNTSDLTCEFGYVSLGEPDFRKGCSTYNWR